MTTRKVISICRYYEAIKQDKEEVSIIELAEVMGLDRTSIYRYEGYLQAWPDWRYGWMLDRYQKYGLTAKELASAILCDYRNAPESYLER